MKTQHNAGFSLIEMAVVIIIAGFIFVPLMAVFVQRDLDQTKSENIENNDRLVAAINFFLKQNGRYPCPARLDAAPSDADFGVESCTGTPTIRTGAIPTRTLGIPYHQAVNSYGWKHIYAVTAELNDATTFNGIGAIRVITPNGTVTDAAQTPYILVNPGQDGKGTTSLYGAPSAVACDAGGAARDNENCDGDAIFVESTPYISLSPTDSGYYDDKLSYGYLSANNDMWLVKREDDLSGKVALTSRTLGNVGIGTDDPLDKFHVGGNGLLETRYGGTGGNLDVQAAVTIENSLLVESEAEINTKFSANNFCIGEYDEEAGQCYDGTLLTKGDEKFECPSGAYLNMDEKTPEEFCKGEGGGCSASDSGNIYTNGQCCYRHELDGTNSCCPASAGLVIDEDGVCRKSDGTLPDDGQDDGTSGQSCPTGEIQDDRGDCCRLTDIDHETGRCEASGDTQPSDDNRQLSSCPLGVDDTEDCCNPSGDSFCCPISVYNSGGNCFTYWD